MRPTVLASVLLFVSSSVAQSGPRMETSNTTESMRGVSVVSRDVAWASGTHGTYLRTINAGAKWIPQQVPGADALDFRAAVGFSADDAFLMSAGPGDQSRIYHTADGGKQWQLQFTNTNPKGFFDSMVFWDNKHGVVLGDPIPDDSGALKFELLTTEDGQNWHTIPPAQLPAAVEGEGAFAASNTCLAILPTRWKSGASAPRQASDETGASAPDANLWFATGGKVARVFHSPDHGKTWEVFPTPIVHGPESAGIFSIAFRDPLHGAIVGGDYKHPNDDGPNLAFTDDGGKTWKLSDLRPQAYFSAVTYDRSVHDSPVPPNTRVKPIPAERIFIVGQDFVFDFRPPNNPHRIQGHKDKSWNAMSAFPEGGVLVVGAKGEIAVIP